MINTIQTNWRRVALLVLASLTFFISAQLVLVNQASAIGITEPKYDFTFTVKFSDPYPAGMTADQFKLDISGTSASGTIISSQNIPLIHYTNDSADVVVSLPAGTYTVTEKGPTSFMPSEWTVKWAGSGCVNTSGPLNTTFTVRPVGADDVTTNVCSADNQWRPGNLRVVKEVVGTSTPFENFSYTVTQDTRVVYNGPFDTDGENEIIVGAGAYQVTEATYPNYTTTYSGACDVNGVGNMIQGGSQTCTVTNTYTGDGNGGNQTGTLIVEKVLVNGDNGTATTSDFSFAVNGGTPTAFEADGQNTLLVATGTYSIVETPTPTNYTVSYRGCTEVVIGANETKTCVITNTYKGDGGGGGDGDKPTYLVFGYVWHDENANENWEMEQPDPNDNESDLAGWTVTITNGSSTYSTTTDGIGYYYFKVPAGTWTIQEVLQADWTKTYPNVNGHVVEVIDESLAQNQVDTNLSGLLAKIKQFILPMAYAAEAATTYGPYNFGNVFFGTGGGGNNGGGNGGGGGSSRVKDRNDGDNQPDPVLPTPLVLGETTEIIPIGAPNTGAGGTSPVVVTLPNLLVTLPTRRRFGV